MPPSINPNLIPLIQPGYMFSRLTTDTSLSVRWVTASDPVFYEIVNRPIADLAVRQLIIARTLDQINLRLGHQSYYPFLVQPKFVGDIYLPLSWIWDMNASLPSKWKNIRLAKVKRVSGSNGTSGSGGTEETPYTGKLRFVFTANQDTSVTETSIFSVDYDIASGLSYQRGTIRAVLPTEEPVAIDPSEYNTIAGQVMFRTLDVNDPEMRALFDFLAPPLTPTDADADGEYDNPTVYQIANSTPGVFDMSAMTHGMGLLVDSAYSHIPDLASSIINWVQAFNYPYRYSAGRKSYTTTSRGNITIPNGMFVEFNMTAPAGDEPSGDISGVNYPVWVSRIKRGTPEADDVSANTLTIYFSTYNTMGSPSVDPVEFATLTLDRAYTSGQIVTINPINNLFAVTGTDSELFNQQMGRGHVVLSSKWALPKTEIDSFFDMFTFIIGDDQAVWLKEAAVISSFGLSRIPKYSPTQGQSLAMRGSAARRAAPVNPSDTNRFVVEDDQGLGDKIDLNEKSFPENPDIERYAYSGALAHKSVTLVVNTAGTSHAYETDILPRLRCLLGRPPIHGDEWFNGTRFLRYDELNGAWVG